MNTEHANYMKKPKTILASDLIYYKQQRDDETKVRLQREDEASKLRDQVQKLSGRCNDLASQKNSLMAVIRSQVDALANFTIRS